MRVRAVPELCSRFHRASELIGRRWTGAIIYVLLRTRCRFADLRAAIPDITDRMLSERLQELEQEGLLVRTVVPETPIRVEYDLTKKGRALAAAMDAIAAWAEEWITLPAGAQHSGNGPTASKSRGAAPRSGGRPGRTARPRRRTGSHV
jgi:DNA-binding HxlR family transcriptional regulator